MPGLSVDKNLLYQYPLRRFWSGRQSRKTDFQRSAGSVESKSLTLLRDSQATVGEQEARPYHIISGPPLIAWTLDPTRIGLGYYTLASHSCRGRRALLEARKNRLATDH